MKLRNSSSLTFADYFYRQVCFFKWRRFKQFAKRLDLVDELVENVLLKGAIVKWVLMTWAPKRKYTMKERVVQMRESVEKSLLQLCNKTVETIKPIAVVMRSEIESTNNHIRRSVIANYELVLSEMRPIIMRMITHTPAISPEELLIKQEQLRKEKLRKLRVHNAIQYASKLQLVEDSDYNNDKNGNILVYSYIKNENIQDNNIDNDLHPVNM